jgi:HTH-type transcriptional regulator/antitoxin HigA
LLHGKKDVYVDFDQDGERTKEEQEADEFAQKWLIPNIRDFKVVNKDVVASVISFAKRNDISPAIVAGRITHELRNNRNIYAHMNPFLKERITYSNLTFGRREVYI